MNPSSKLNQASALPSPASLFQRSTSSPSPFEAVYRSIDVEVLPMPRLSAPAPKAKAAAVVAPAAKADLFPHLMWPLVAYPLGQFSVFCADEPAALVERVQAQLVAQGCEVSREACNVLACSLNTSDNAHSRFSVAVWDVTYDPSAPPQPTLVDVQRLAGCPFLFQRVVGQVMCKPTERKFQCLPVPDSFSSAGSIEAGDIDAAIVRCTQGDTPARVEAVVALSKQCASDALLRQSLCAANGRARLAGLLDDAPLAAHVERLFQLL